MKEFVTKDSGKRTEFASGMVRDTDEDKTNWALVFRGPMLKRWADLLTRGAKKYEKDNWMKASGQAELDRFIESATRHFAQWIAGETDEDHAAAVIYNINGAEYVRTRLPQGQPRQSEPVRRRMVSMTDLGTGDSHPEVLAEDVKTPYGQTCAKAGCEPLF